jgi:hypothetical protein
MRLHAIAGLNINTEVGSSASPVVCNIMTNIPEVFGSSTLNIK